MFRHRVCVAFVIHSYSDQGSLGFLHLVSSRSKVKETNWRKFIQFCDFLFLLLLKTQRINSVFSTVRTFNISVTVSLIRLK